MPTRYGPIEKIVSRLERVRLKSILIAVATAIVIACTILGFGWLVTSFLDLGFGIARMWLRLLALVSAVSAFAGLVYGMVRVFSVSHSLKAYAARIASELREIGHDVLTALELSEVDSERLGYSNILIKRVLEDINQKIESVRIDVIASQKRLLLWAIPLLATVAFAAAWRSYDSPTLSYSLERFGYFLALTPSSGIELRVSPGNHKMLAGDSLTVSAEITGFTPGRATLHMLQDGAETAFEMNLAESEGKAKRVFATILPSVDRDIAYFVTYGDERSTTYAISVYEKPRIVGGIVKLTYPAYTGRDEQILPKGIWDITAPYGTRVQFLLEANCEPDSAWLTIEDNKPKQHRLKLVERKDSLAISVTIHENLSYTINLAAGGLSSEPHGPHTINVVPDDPPYVRIESPQEEMMLEADMLVPLSVVAVDDYGISQMRLHYAAPSETSSIALDFKGTTHARADLDWNVSELNLFPGDVVTYWVAVADNDALKGPKYAKSDVHTFKVPAIHEIYQAIENEQEQDIGELEEVADEASELKEEIDNLIENMKRKSEVGWEEQQALEQNLEKHKELLDRLEDISASLDETLNRMNENNLITFEIIEKMEEVRQLINEVASEELLKAIEKMQQALQQLSPEEIRQAMENFNISQEDLLRRLDRTIELLKKMKLQQRMEAVTNLAKQIADEQSGLNKKIEEGGDLKEAASKEKALIDKTNALEEMMNQLAELLKEQGNPLEGEIRKAGEFLKAQNISGSMSMAMSAMQAGNQAEASAQGKQAEVDMAKLAMMLQTTRDALMGEDKRALMEALRNAIDVLRDVSQRHEEVLAEIDTTRGKRLSDLARREVIYKEALDRVADHIFKAARKSLFIGPRLGGAVLQIAKDLESTSEIIAQQKPGLARQQGRAALGKMNQLVTALMDAMDQASSCSSPSGLCETFKNLESMCCMQMGINMGTQQLQDLSQGGLSMEQRAQMARLAAEQETVRKGIEDIARELRGRSEILGRLDDLAEEARKVVDDLKNQHVDEETIRRQEKILTRLLNAQKSLRRRDYSRRRQSRPGGEYEIKPPPELSLEERERFLQDMLYRKKGYYPPEYENLIRAYLEAIAAGKEAK